MSILKVRPTDYHTTEQTVLHKLESVRIDELRDLKKLRVWGLLVGNVQDTPGTIVTYESSMNLTELKEGLSVTERQAARTFIAALERELAKKVSPIEDGTYTDTDVFVDNS